MKHNVIETAMGAVVLAVAGFFLVFVLKTAKVDTGSGYDVKADFVNAQGLDIGSDVKIGGVKIGSVSAIDLDPASYMAVATLTINEDVKLPTDTSATIRSSSLMGGKFLALEPGGADDMLAAGGKIEHTQSTPDLEQLLGQAIFSMSQSKSSEGAATAPATAQP